MAAIGPYDVERELGRGGMGRVLLVRHRETGARRALKILEGEIDAALVARFEREAATLARLDAAGVVPIHDTGVVAGRPWFAMAVMPGGSLRDRIKAQGRLPWRDAALLGAKLARTLERAHELGLVHRDLKPENILFDEQGEPRIADWGCARDLQSQTRLTETGALLGTVAYMGPEQLDGRPAGPPADVFALGCMLYELVSGTQPHAGRTAMEVFSRVLGAKRAPLGSLAKVPPVYEDAVERALAKDAAARIPAGALAEALEVCEEDEPPPRSRVAVVAALVVVCGLGVLGALARRYLDAKSRDSTTPAVHDTAKARREIVATTDAARLRDEELERRLAAAIAKEPGAHDLREARARAFLRWRQPVDAGDLAALASTTIAAELAQSACRYGVTGDASAIAALVTAGRAAKGPLAALAAVAELRSGSATDLDWTERALAGSSIDGASELARTLRASRLIATLLDPDDLKLEYTQLRPAMRDLALSIPVIRQRLGDPTLVAVLAPATRALRTLVIPPEKKGLRESAALAVVDTQLDAVPAPPTFEAVLTLLLQAKSALLIPRVRAPASLVVVDADDPVIAIYLRTYLVRRAAEVDASLAGRLWQVEVLRPLRALGERARATATGRERTGANILLADGLLYALSAETAIANLDPATRTEHLERAGAHFDFQTTIVREVADDPDRGISTLAQIETFRADNFYAVWSEKREAAILANLSKLSEGDRTELLWAIANAMISGNSSPARVREYAERARAITSSREKPGYRQTVVERWLEERKGR